MALSIEHIHFNDLNNVHAKHSTFINQTPDEISQQKSRGIFKYYNGLALACTADWQLIRPTIPGDGTRVGSIVHPFTPAMASLDILDMS